MNKLAEIYKKQNMDDEAIGIYNRLIKENPNDIEAYLNIGQIYYNKGDYENAISNLEKTKTIDPDNVQIQFAITKCKGEQLEATDQDSYNQIIEDYLKLQNNPDLPPEFNVSFAKVYAKNGQLDEAFQYCKKAIEINDADIEAYRLLGLIQLINKDLAGAKNSLSVALNLQPSNIETHDIFSYLLCNQAQDCEKEKCRRNYYKLIEKYIK